MKDHRHNGEDKRSLLLEDLCIHSPEQLAELRLLLDSGTPLETIRESAAFFAVEGPLNVFCVCENRADTGILLIVARRRRQHQLAWEAVYQVEEVRDNN